MSDEPFRILVICTANVCRSPMAETLIRTAASDAGVAVDVSSAGFLSHDEDATPVVVEIMSERGHDISDHRSRIATADMVAAADVVVTMERRHARDLTLLAQGAAEKIDTLGGIVKRLADVNGDTPADRLAAAAAQRDASDMLGNGDDEIDDPFGKSKKVNRETADRLTELSEALIVGMFRPDQ